MFLAMHECRKIEPFFRHHFHTCEIFILNIPHYGLYNFAYSNNSDNVLISLIVEHGTHTHRVNYDEENRFKPHTIKINRFDQVLFHLSSATRASIIYQTDEYGNRLEPEQILFQSQQNNIDYIMKQFSQLGVYYFSTDIKNHDKRKRKQSSTYPLAIIVLPEIRFHYKSVDKGKFDSETVMTTNTNDFFIWKFERTISHDVIRLRSNATFKDLISCYERAIAGKNRRCLAIDCKSIPPGASFFCNPDFEQVTGSYQDRFISTIIIDPPFSQYSFIITNKQFVPKVLYIKKNDTVSWILKDNQSNHRIYVQSIESDDQDDENIPIHRNIAEYVNGVYHLHTFNKRGKYIIKSNGFPSTATVFVDLDIDIRSSDKKREVQQPEIREDIYPVSPFDTQIHLDCPNHRNINIYYTLDGLPPTQHDKNVHFYDSNRGVRFRAPGLHVLRAYSTEDKKLSSSIITSSPTFVMEDEEFEPSWNNCKLTLPDSLSVSNEPSTMFSMEAHIGVRDSEYKTLSTIEMSRQRSDTEDDDDKKNKYKNLKEHQQPSTSTGPSITQIKLDIHKTNSKLKEPPKRPTEKTHGETSVSLDDFNYRAEILLKKLTRAIENRSKELNSTRIHPHTSYPGTYHYKHN
ncbi:unnamed protein product [Rotaria sordida]|uniref:Uncharacterized protein n=1 Tax=Rotaria sordida TaxID=392033 RepID=A0A816CFZ0_9BILA|nr:unnamed protein product [Rotaria sordida]CAF1624268.1 unnamed protein product [Rotaria sordida]